MTQAALRPPNGRGAVFFFMIPPPQDMTFSLSISGQTVTVRYRTHRFDLPNLAHFEFNSPQTPRRPIPMSETGYRSHFAFIDGVDGLPDPEAYARAVALALTEARTGGKGADDDRQMELF